jgi:hypothetical protein
MRDRLAIVGLVEPECWDAPWDNDAYEIWTLNSGCQLFQDKRIDLLFDMHDWDASDYEPLYYEWLQKAPRDYPVMKTNPTDKLSNCLIYPADEVISYFGTNFANSICYMIAYAAIKQWEIVEIWGTNGDEFERNIDMLKSLYEIIGGVRQFGTRVYFAGKEQITRNKMYGYSAFEWEKVKDDVPIDARWAYKVKDESKTED